MKGHRAWLRVAVMPLFGRDLGRWEALSVFGEVYDAPQLAVFNNSVLCAVAALHTPPVCLDILLPDS